MVPQESKSFPMLILASTPFCQAKARNRSLQHKKVPFRDEMAPLGAPDGPRAGGHRHFSATPIAGAEVYDANRAVERHIGHGRCNLCGRRECSASEKILRPLQLGWEDGDFGVQGSEHHHHGHARSNASCAALRAAALPHLPRGEVQHQLTRCAARDSAQVGYLYSVSAMEWTT